MDSKKGKISEPYDLILKLTDKRDLRIDGREKSVALSNLIIYYTWKNIKISYNNNKFNISAPTWNDKFKLPDGLYSVPDIQDYFEYILKKHGENTDNPSVQLRLLYQNQTNKTNKLNINVFIFRLPSKPSTESMVLY